MNILFIYRDKHYTTHNFNKIFNKNLCKCDFGFFLLSLKSFSNVKVVSIREFLHLQNTDDYDHVVIDVKISLEYNEEKYLSIFKERIISKTSLFISYDGPFNFHQVKNFERYLDIQSYFIPNLLTDIDHYNLPIHLKDKIFSTYYGLGFLEISYDNDTKKFLYFQNEKNYEYDLFYSGVKTENRPERTLVINHLISEQTFYKKKIIFYDQNNVNNLKLSSQDYIKHTIKSKINLVLSGNLNNIAYRFYEVLFFKRFFLIDKNFLRYEVSRNFNDVYKFVFHSNYDLSNKIKYFIKNQNEMEEIRKNQTKVFKKFYDPNKHGEKILKIISR